MMTAPRPVVIVLTTYYLPGYKAGGPIRTIRNLVAALSDQFDFRIITSDHEVGQREPFTSVAINDWNLIEGAQVYYADAVSRRPWQLAAAITAVAPDIVYANSFFSPGFSIIPFVMRWLGRTDPHTPWIIAPRGEFSPGAVVIKSRKKRSFITAARAAGLHRGAIWQASSPLEAADIEREIGVPRDLIHVAPNLTAPVEHDLPIGSPCRDPSRLSVCFLARVCAMKNLSFAIETLAHCSSPIDLHIYGPVEDEAYAARCRDLVPAGDATLRVFWHGEVPPEHVRSTLADHDVFFLPTLGENFGHGIFEALAAGVPVLVSDRTPWRDLDAEGVGWVRSLDDPGGFVAAIEGLVAMPAEARLAMRQRAHAYAARFAASSEARDANRRLFEFAVDQANGPRSRRSTG